MLMFPFLVLECWKVQHEVYPGADGTPGKWGNNRKASWCVEFCTAELDRCVKFFSSSTGNQKLNAELLLFDCSLGCFLPSFFLSLASSPDSVRTFAPCCRASVTGSSAGSSSASLQDQTGGVGSQESIWRYMIWFYWDAENPEKPWNPRNMSSPSTQRVKDVISPVWKNSLSP